MQDSIQGACIFYINNKSRRKIYNFYHWYDFKIANALITNFHLPKSTLIMLVAAFIGARLCEEHLQSKADEAISIRTKESIKTIISLYELAKTNNFRFFSFGDCMFIS